MIEKHFVLEDVDPVLFYGAGNSNMQLIKALFPKLRIVARDSVIRVMGDSTELNRFEEVLVKLERYCNEYNSLKEENIVDIINGQEPSGEKSSNVILFGVTGRPIIPRSENQKKIVDDYATNDMIFAIGPAGSGKTYTAVALAVRALKAKVVRRIILTRPAVEAGENLGFLPGDLKEKLDPYLQPLYDALRDMLSQQKLESLIQQGVIEIAPLAFMRGRTLDNAFVILDEAQNTSMEQLKMFLTRMGRNSKFIITGDVTQIDLPKNQLSGLLPTIEKVKHIKGIAVIELQSCDIVRHKLVSKIIEALD